MDYGVSVDWPNVADEVSEERPPLLAINGPMTASQIRIEFAPRFRGRGQASQMPPEPSALLQLMQVLRAALYLSLPQRQWMSLRVRLPWIRSDCRQPRYRQAQVSVLHWEGVCVLWATYDRRWSDFIVEVFLYPQVIAGHVGRCICCCPPAHQ
jgi:hypothetical protein